MTMGKIRRVSELWAQADEEGRREILQTVIVQLTIDEKRTLDVELRPPYNWLAMWTPPAMVDAQNRHRESN